jgi:hypothetical protein
VAWYDEIVRRDRIASEAPMGWRWMRDKAFNLLGTDMPQVARNQARNIGGALKQPRPRNEPWQNQMVDPNWGGGKFGAPGIGGEEMLIGSLPMAGMYKQFWNPGLAMTRRLSPQQLLQQMRRRLRRRDPSLTAPVRPRTDNVVRDYRRMLRPQYGGRGSTFAGRRYGARTTLDDLRKAYE